ncbi:MAG: SDR family oxidoreductase [Archangiaceae bacterium]|nr:SDR family oxidoreductase [Archangiaceae bacterium]
MGYETPRVKTILITGATSGIGLEAAVALARQGHRLVLVGRTPNKTDLAIATVKQRSSSAAVEGLSCDFGSQRQIRALAAAYRAKYPRLEVLVNNAGLVTPSRQVTEDGLETTFAVNHLGYFLLTTLLLDLIVQSAPARIVNVASIGHYQGTMSFDDLGFEKGGWSVMKAYQRSKLGNVLFTRLLAKKLQGQGVTVNALHPGGVDTPIWDKAPWYAKPFLAVMRWAFLITPQEGGQTLVHLASSPQIEGQTGLYFSDNKVTEPSKLAQDEALAERLWQVSEALVTPSAPRP